MVRTLAAGFVVLAAGLPSQEVRRLAVHEWGTFTVLQDESGKALPGVNINEESLPRFVHRLARDLAPDSHELGPVLSVGTHAKYASKGIPRSFPAARMRMETPILYFYPGKPGVTTLDVRVDFLHGWISEWYPDAINVAPGFEKGRLPRSIPEGRHGSIEWRGLRVGVEREPPATDSKVWTAPRVAAAASVETVGERQTERYLFYRGVADLKAPLRVSREGGALVVRAQVRELATQVPYRFPALWLVDVRKDGRVAHRPVAAITAGLDTKRVLARIPAGFGREDFRKGGLERLRTTMDMELRRAGLFAAESRAMLDTWEVSYFHSPGLRLFFVLPRPWIDGVLPLHVSAEADIDRVMIGRIELVTPEQRKLARALATTAQVSKPQWFYAAIQKLPPARRDAVVTTLTAGSKRLADHAIVAPEDYRTYLSIGRFRDAIVLDESRRRPTPALREFVKNYQLAYFQQDGVTRR